MDIDLKAENKALRKQVLVETIRRLSAESQAAKASMAAIQMRIPQIEYEMNIAQAKLVEITKDEGDGSSGH